MVDLIGVVHSGNQIRIMPTSGLCSMLASYPKGSKVGIEQLSTDDWLDVEQNLLKLRDNSKILHGDRKKLLPLRYENGTRRYFDAIERACKEFGHEIIFLDDKEQWHSYNREVISSIEKKLMNPIKALKNETTEQVELKRLSRNTRNFQSTISIRRVHEISRDDAMLERIAIKKPDVAIVGLSHSDLWINEKSKKGPLHYESFQKYSRETVEFKDDGRLMQSFILDASPDPKIAFQRESLMRSIRLIERGELKDEKADGAIWRVYGTWDVSFPYRGYFELRTTLGMACRTDDCIGDGNGEILRNDDELSFTKRYEPELCTPNALIDEISYRGIRRDGVIAGFFADRSRRFRGEFVARESKPAEIEGLGMDWVRFYDNHADDLQKLADDMFK